MPNKPILVNPARALTPGQHASECKCEECIDRKLTFIGVCKEQSEHGNPAIAPRLLEQHIHNQLCMAMGEDDCLLFLHKDTDNDETFAAIHFPPSLILSMASMYIRKLGSKGKTFKIDGMSLSTDDLVEIINFAARNQQERERSCGAPTGTTKVLTPDANMKDEWAKLANDADLGTNPLLADSRETISHESADDTNRPLKFTRHPHANVLN